MRAVLWVVTTLACLALDARLGSAQASKRFALNWVRDVGAESCITSHRLAAILQGMFGPVFVTQDQAELAIEGSVGRAADEWRARIVVSDRAGAVLGVRELGSAAEGCSALDAQIVLVIAMAIDPEVALEGLPPELLAELGAPADAADELLSELRASSAAAQPRPAATAKTPPPATPPPAEPPPPASRARAREREDSGRFAAFAQLGLNAELLPTVQPQLGLGVELQLMRRLHLLAQGAWSLPSIVQLGSPGIEDASVRFDLTLAAAAACFSALQTASLRAYGCVGPTLLIRGAEGRGLANPASTVQLDAAATVTAGASYTGLTPWLFGLGAAVHAPFRRLRFSYRVSGATQTTELFTSPVVGVAGWISAGIEL